MWRWLASPGARLHVCDSQCANLMYAASVYGPRGTCSAASARNEMCYAGALVVKFWCKFSHELGPCCYGGRWVRGRLVAHRARTAAARLWVHACGGLCVVARRLRRVYIWRGLLARWPGGADGLAL